MEIIDRYIYAVTRQLAEGDKKDVASELRALIHDMTEGEDKDLSEEARVRNAIVELGNPDELASRYRGKDRYLIGPKYFYAYLLVLKIVLLAILVGVSVATFIGIIFKGSLSWGLVGDYLGTIFSALLQGSAWVTIIFALLDYKDVDLKKKVWSIDELPEIPHNNSRISKVEAAVSIVFTTLFFAIVYFAPDLFGVYYYSNGEWTNNPILNVDVLARYNTIIVAIFAIELLKETLKILWGKWNIKRAVVSSIASIVTGIMTVIILSNKEIWNSLVSEALHKYTGFAFGWIMSIVVVVVAIATVIDVITSLYKGIKYGGHAA